MCDSYIERFSWSERQASFATAPAVNNELFSITIEQVSKIVTERS